MKSRFNVFYDIETFSNDPHKGVVIDINAFIFDMEKMISDNPYTCKDLANVARFKISTDDQMENYSYVVDQGVIDFWKQQDSNIKKRIGKSDNDLTLEQAINQFVAFLRSEPKLSYVWCNSKSTQSVILNRLFADVGKKKSDIINYYDEVDMMTYINAKFNFDVNVDICPIEDEEFWNKIYNKNNGAFDVIANVLRIQAIYRAENDLENINR